MILKRSRQEAATFIAVGILNTAVDFSVYFFLTRALPPFYSHRVAAKAISFLCGSLMSFFGNRMWTFRSENKTNISEVSRFYIAICAGAALNSFTMKLLLAQVPEIIAMIGATIVTIGWNFSFMKWWVFRK